MNFRLARGCFGATVECLSSGIGRWILTYLADRPGEVIAKQELMDHVWSDVTVEEGSLRVHVAAIRKALGDGQFGNRYIANIKGRGYSLVGTVVPLAGGTEIRNANFPHLHALAPSRIESGFRYSLSYSLTDLKIPGGSHPQVVRTTLPPLRRSVQSLAPPRGPQR